MPIELPHGWKNPQLDFFLKGLTHYKFKELWTGEVPADLRAIWNNMPTGWKVKLRGWGHDPKWIEQAIRARCRDFMISARYAEKAATQYLRKIPTTIKVSPWAYYTIKASAMTAGAAATGLLAAIGALTYAFYWGGLFGDPYETTYEPRKWIDPTIMLNDNWQTGKIAELIPSDETVKFSLAHGSGLAGSNALRVTFLPTSKDEWRFAQIRYRFPGPLRQKVLCGFNLRNITDIPLIAAQFSMSFTWAEFIYHTGFGFNSSDFEFPWYIIQNVPQTRFRSDRDHRLISSIYSPSWWEIDLLNTEYSQLNTFGQLQPVTRARPFRSPAKEPLPGEFNIILQHAWAEQLVIELDAALIYEYGPYRDNIRAELNKRETDSPIEEKLPSALT